MRIRRYLRIELIIVTTAIAARMIPGPRIVDDAYITFRYTQNLLSGHGLVYNPGEAVLGTTTPAYALFLSVLGILGGGAQAPFPTIALIVNALADGLTCWLLVKLGERLGHRRAGLATSIVWAIAPWSVRFAIGGMETSFFILLMITTFYLHSTERPIWASLFAGLSLLTRPDALLFIGPLAIERLRQYWIASKDRQQILRSVWMELAAFGVPTVSWAIVGFIIYGNPVPHSILAKVAAYQLPRNAAFTRLLQHYGTPFLGHTILGLWWIGAGLLIYLALFLLGASKIIRDQTHTWPIFLFPWVYFLAFAIANPLIFLWYLTPPLPMYFLGIFTGVERIGEKWKPPLLIVIATLLAFASSLSDWTLHPDHGPDRPAPALSYIQLELLYQEVAESLRHQIEPNQVLAAGDIGTLGYYTGAQILDTIGLITPQSLPYYPAPDSAYVINYAIPSDLILDLAPDYLVTLEVYIRNTLLMDPAFAQHYELHARFPTDIYTSKDMLVYRRLSAP